ncbi:unnamed protein product [Closterium sp. NIES-54]
MFHARLAHVGVDTIKSSTKHEVATGLDIKKSTAADLPGASYVSSKLAWHTFPDQGSDTENAPDVVHINLCRPFRVAANDGSLYFLLLKDRKTRCVWVRPIAKKSDVLIVFEKWLKEVEWQTSKTVKKLRSDRGGEFLGCAFTDLIEDKGILHNLICPYTTQQNGMAKREMRTVVEAVRTMLLHMGMKHHLWHIALRQAVWVRNCLERASLPKGTTSHELLFEKKLDLTLARVWGCMSESKGWEVLDLTDNKVVTSVEAIFYETLSLELWKAEYGLASTRTSSAPPPDSSSEMPPLLAVVDEHDDKDVEEVPLPPPVVPSLAAGDEGRLGASPAAPTNCIAGGRRNAKKVSDGKRQMTRKLLATSPTSEKASGEVPPIEKLLAEAPASGEPLAEKPILGEPSVEELATGEQFDDDPSSDDVVEVVGEAGGGEGELFEDNDLVDVVVERRNRDILQHWQAAREDELPRLFATNGLHHYA